MGDVLGGPDLSQVLEYSAHTVLQPPDPSRAFPEAFGGCLCFTFAKRKRKWEEGRGRVGSGPGLPVRDPHIKASISGLPRVTGK